jgi:hypothetical protein
MKTLDQILSEVYDHGDTKPSSKLGFSKLLGKPVPKDHKHIGNIGKHKVYHGVHDKGMDRYSVTDHEGNVSNILTVKKHKNHIKVDGSVTNGKGPKQHELYHHLIKKHDHTITTDAQTSGGYHVWKQLAKKRSVNIHGWDPKKKEAVNVDHRLRDRDETHHDLTNHKGHAHITNMHLVAHKK